jgi:hypothetical protein
MRYSRLSASYRRRRRSRNLHCARRLQNLGAGAPTIAANCSSNACSTMRLPSRDVNASFTMPVVGRYVATHACVREHSADHA